MTAKRNPSKDTVTDDPDGGHGDAIDAFISRNRDELNTAIHQARLEFEQNGQTGQTVESIIAAGLKRYDVR